MSAAATCLGTFLCSIELPHVPLACLGSLFTGAALLSPPGLVRVRWRRPCSLASVLCLPQSVLCLLVTPAPLPPTRILGTDLLTPPPWPAPWGLSASYHQTGSHSGPRLDPVPCPALPWTTEHSCLPRPWALSGVRFPRGLAARQGCAADAASDWPAGPSASPRAPDLQVPADPAPEPGLPGHDRGLQPEHAVPAPRRECPQMGGGGPHPCPAQSGTASRCRRRERTAECVTWNNQVTDGSVERGREAGQTEL